MRIALALLLLIATTAGPALSAADARPLHIVVLRLEDVLRGAKVYSARMDGLKKEKADADAKLKAFSEQQQQLDNQIQALNPGNERYYQAAEEAEVIKVRAKFYMDRARAVLERKNATALKECYATVRAALKDYSPREGHRPGRARAQPRGPGQPREHPAPARPADRALLRPVPGHHRRLHRLPERALRRRGRRARAAARSGPGPAARSGGAARCGRGSGPARGEVTCE